MNIKIAYGKHGISPADSRYGEIIYSAVIKQAMYKNLISAIVYLLYSLILLCSRRSTTLPALVSLFYLCLGIRYFTIALVLVLWLPSTEASLTHLCRTTVRTNLNSFTHLSTSLCIHYFNIYHSQDCLSSSLRFVAFLFSIAFSLRLISLGKCS